MLQNENGKIYFTECFELRGYRSHSLHWLEKGDHAPQSFLIAPLLR
jgi:hypothetical protein